MSPLAKRYLEILRHYVKDFIPTQDVLLEPDDSERS